MASNYKTVNILTGPIDLDDEYITDAWLIDRFVGTQLWGCGYNTLGGLGVGDVVHRSSPVQIGSLTNWGHIESGVFASVGYKTDGTLWSWGENTASTGELGSGAVSSRSSPVQIGALTNWTSNFSFKYRQCAAIKTDGSLWVWGFNTNGVLGLGDQVHRSSPVQVGSLLSWKSVSTGYTHTAAIRIDGTLWTWGANTNGQLGLGDIVHRSSPVQVGSDKDWKYVVAHYTSRTLAIKTDGTLWAWGHNAVGTLGLGDVIDRSSPTQVGSLTDWKRLVDGDSGGAIKTDGTLWVWGGNTSGALGLGDLVHRSSPTQVGSLQNWKYAHIHGTLTAIKTDGTLWVSGSNTFGQLGLGDIIPRSSPTQVGSSTNWKSLGPCRNSKFFLKIFDY